jgi:hypothetical protein
MNFIVWTVIPNLKNLFFLKQNYLLVRTAQAQRPKSSFQDLAEIKIPVPAQIFRQCLPNLPPAAVRAVRAALARLAGINI